MAINELLSLLEYVEQERGISREELIDALEKSLASAGKKSIDYGKDIRVRVNKHTGNITAWVDFTVSNDTSSRENISLEDAKKLSATAKEGDTVSKEIPHKDFGRIAAQTAKQTMMQQLKKAEKSRVYEEFKDNIGQIVSGVVRRFEEGNAILDFQKAEGILSIREKIPSDSFTAGERINALLKEIDTMGSGPSLILSRRSKQFLRKLFEREVSEIADGTVELKDIAREPGSRAKISVISHDQRVDPIGACIGVRGSRVKNITAELSGERIDIIRYDEDIIKYITNAMQPAVPIKVEITNEGKSANVYVSKDQIKLAIGKNWQNAKLVSQLVGFERVNVLIVEEDSDFEKQLHEVIKNMSEKLSISEEISGILAKNGIISVDGLKGVTREDLVAMNSLSEEAVNQLLEKAKQLE